ncbi:MAG: type II secretion system inner membrane protein GspF [Candidatus Competibacteraceae bacterium]|nr:type II secretion system inner membrane protein GspF [Candidatus Competibacteraceae bacterium]MBK7983801.1 type II secretion system inner membrane protein GspF [Candidatus Competibacteraceae bacterium]MBK8897658.1 type II secretion system inner membrane protein GspF [Candidatus Competibacteraceae bacterium]MBK8963803.1 type II secretion system inner membrane protein GspF [Candidatus Competibacteraceae bacterium]MBK9950692.1 type II secretion system inner membrane protein GspF [Candidatus Com
MPRYRYEAVDAAGEVLRDELEAASADAAIERLRDQGLLPLSVDEAKGGLLRGGLGQPLFSKRRALSRKALGVFTQQLASLLGAGMPLDRALTILIGVAEDERGKALLERVQAKVRGGSTLADALEAQGAFSRFYLNMVRAGESGGALETVLKRLNEFLERSQALRETVTSALIYPIILLSVAVLSVIILLTFVVPQFERLFADAGKALPLATQVVIALGNGFRHYWWVGLIVIGSIVTVARRQLNQPDSRARWDRRLLRLPLFGDLIAKVETARLSRTLGTLLGNGVSLLSALTIVRETLSNQILAGALGEVAEHAKTGRGLAEPLLEAGHFPKLAVQMIRVGEETGQLQEMLIQVADTYDGEVQTAVKRLLTLLEPALILGLGVVVAGIIMSILVAILSLNDLAF